MIDSKTVVHMISTSLELAGKKLITGPSPSALGKLLGEGEIGVFYSEYPDGQVASFYYQPRKSEIAKGFRGCLRRLGNTNQSYDDNAIYNLSVEVAKVLKPKYNY